MFSSMIVAVVLSRNSVHIMYTAVVPTLVRRGVGSRALSQHVSDLADAKYGIIVGNVPL